jgi:hypothetical protein
MPQLVIAGEDPVVFSNAVTFEGTKSAMLDKVEPRYGTRLGGDTVKFSGQNFSDDKSKYTITIDGVDCPVETATTSYVECKTGRRDKMVESSLSIWIDGMG